jgi:hypothetical protein
MTPEGLFSIVNPLAAVGWLLLLVLYNRPWVVGTVVKVVLPLALALVYVALIPRFFTSTGGFDSLDAVARLFGDRWLLLAGWVHYLCFDLLIGAWEVEDARQRGIPRLLVVPCLLLTFLFGPAGWLLYKAIASAHRRAPA